MNNWGNLIVSLAVLVVLFLFFPKRAYAYLDPGTGSYVIQILVAALVGSAVAVRVFWRNIRMFFQRLFSRRRDQEEETDEEVPEQEEQNQEDESDQEAPEQEEQNEDEE